MFVKCKLYIPRQTDRILYSSNKLDAKTLSEQVFLPCMGREAFTDPYTNKFELIKQKVYSACIGSSDGKVNLYAISGIYYFA